MEYRIEKLAAFKIIGYKMHSTNAWMKGMRDCPAFWKKIIKEKKNDVLVPLINRQPLGLIGASVYNVDSNDSRKFDYYIAVSSDAKTSSGLEEYWIPAMTWAVFSCTKKTRGKTQMDIVNKWAPKAEYELLNTGYRTGKMNSAAPDLEVYGRETDVEIWVPVRKKQGE